MGFNFLRSSVAAGGGAPAYTPFFTWSAAGGTLGNTVTGWTSVQFSRVTYSNDIAGPFGGGTVAKQALVSTSNWFGGQWVNNITAQNIGNGGDIWVRQYLYFPSDFQFAYGTVSGDGWGNVKWIRLQFSTGETSRNTLQLGDLGGDALPSAPSFATQVGWGGFTDEYGGDGFNGVIASPAAQVTRGSWVAIQTHVKLASDSTGYVESWIGTTYLGKATKNGATAYQTISSGGVLDDVFFGDYWNGGPGFTDDFYLDEIIITAQTPDTLDSGGRPYISPSTKVEDF